MCALYVDIDLSPGYSGATVYPEDGDRVLLRKPSKHLPQQITATATHVLHRDVCILPDSKQTLTGNLFSNHVCVSGTKRDLTPLAQNSNYM
jgi:hypothetical protein